ncbi:MAG: DUF4836 family protein [Verrucomicrobiota bacterium]|jgi:hypothetical protein|nr:DUF4836 family protein [Verrucomicrobiota bacterium]
MQSGKAKHAMSQHGGTGMVIAAIAVVLTMAGLIAWLLLNPTTRPHRETGEVIPSNAGAVFSFYPSRLVNKSGLPDFLREHLDDLGGMAMMIDPNQLDTLADFTRLGINEDQPLHLFFQQSDNGPRAGLILPLISREAFEKGMKNNMPGNFGDEILKQMTEERGLRGIFTGQWPFVFAYDHHVLVLLFEEPQFGGNSMDRRTKLHELFDQESGLSSTEPSFARYVGAEHDIGYWVKLETLPGLLGDELPMNLDQLDDQLQGITTMGIRFEPGEAILDLMLPGEHRLPVRPMDPELLKTMPDDSALIFAGGVDLKEIGKQVGATLVGDNGLINQLGDEVTMEKFHEIIKNLTGGVNIDLDAQFTGDVALAFTDFEMKKVTKAPVIPLPLPDNLQLPMPKLHMSGSFKTKTNADTEALLKQFTLTEALGLEAFERDGMIHLASPNLRKSIEQNGTVPNPIDEQTREQLAARGATITLDFNRLLKILDKFPKQRAAVAGLESLESLVLTLSSNNGEDHAVLKLRLNNKKTNALRQMVEMGANLSREENSAPVGEGDR